MGVCILERAAATVMYTLSLHDALPICPEALDAGLGLGRGLLVGLGEHHREGRAGLDDPFNEGQVDRLRLQAGVDQDRKSTRLNSSHGYISYAVFCLKKKKNQYSVVQCT